MCPTSKPVAESRSTMAVKVLMSPTTLARRTGRVKGWSAEPFTGKATPFIPEFRKKQTGATVLPQKKPAGRPRSLKENGIVTESLTSDQDAIGSGFIVFHSPRVKSGISIGWLPAETERVESSRMEDHAAAS